MNKRTVFLLLFSAQLSVCFAQYPNYVKIKTSSIDNEAFGIIKLLRKDNHVKVKYFAAKDADGTSVYERYQKWAVNKKVIAFSSGTYMNSCEFPSLASPIGLCIDQGNVVNSNLLRDKLDALAIVYATGGMVATNLVDGNLKITYPDKSTKTVDIRNDAYGKIEFIKWATDEEATVFQAHLFVYEDKLKLGTNADATMATRRFLAVCKEANDQIAHYVINLPTEATLYKGATKAFRILKELEEVKQIVFMINLDTGCQNVFNAFDEAGGQHSNPLLKGDRPINSAINLLAYYYE
jgi:hypothetical protein